MNDSGEMLKEMIPNLPLWSFQFKPNSKLALRTRKDWEIHLITRALKDEEFKHELLANPKIVVEKELGTKLPEDLEINVLEEEQDTVYMVLPCNPYEGMSEEDLQASLGITYEDVARWVLEQQRNTLLDEDINLNLVVQTWKDKRFKKSFVNNPQLVLEQKGWVNFSADTIIKVFEENKNQVYLVIPILLDQFEDLNVSDHQWSNVNLKMLLIGSTTNRDGCSNWVC
jgi:hypothetical protein